MMDVKYIERNVIDPTGIVQVYRDYWWWCVNGDPTRAIFYIMGFGQREIGSPQCNANKSVCEIVNANNHMNYPEGTELIQIPLAFVPWKN